MHESEPGMKIATFNINGVKARLPALLGVAYKPNVGDAREAPSLPIIRQLCDLGAEVVAVDPYVDETFPAEAIEDKGWNVVTHGQKGFNGVAILSKRPLEDISRGLPGDADDEQARWIEATVMGDAQAVRLCCLYLPNGNPAPGPKYDYKLAWMARLEAHARTLLATEMPVVMLGDYNVIPQDEDAARPEAWRKDALALPQSRAAFRRLLHQGWTEGLRARHAAPGIYTFWDYQAGAWDRDDGIRIDHVLLSPQAADLMTDLQVDAEIRGREKPSDHVPVWVELAA